MKKSVLSQYEQGSAELVIAHAAWQHSRGRHCSMAFLGERNPQKALRLAKSVISGEQHAESLYQIGARFVERKQYANMTDLEIKIAARNIITSSSSEEEVERRLRDEMGYRFGINLCTEIPTDEIGRQARELVRGLGGLIMKNGAMAMAMMQGHDNTILL